MLINNNKSSNAKIDIFKNLNKLIFNIKKMILFKI